MTNYWPSNIMWRCLIFHECERRFLHEIFVHRKEKTDGDDLETEKEGRRPNVAIRSSEFSFLLEKKYSETKLWNNFGKIVGTSMTKIPKLSPVKNPKILWSLKICILTISRAFWFSCRVLYYLLRKSGEIHKMKTFVYWPIDQDSFDTFFPAITFNCPQ